MNLKEETIEFIGDKEILCAEIHIYVSKKIIIEILLKKEFTNSDEIIFLNQLNFKYIQQIYGTIWFKNGSWGSYEQDQHSKLYHWKHYNLPRHTLANLDEDNIDNFFPCIPCKLEF